eukprot:COSAG02_NODE_3948_length_6001_cov_23.394844_7_plen_22_part_01
MAAVAEGWRKVDRPKLLAQGRN